MDLVIFTEEVLNGKLSFFSTVIFTNERSQSLYIKLNSNASDFFSYVFVIILCQQLYCFICHLHVSNYQIEKQVTKRLGLSLPYLPSERVL